MKYGKRISLFLLCALALLLVAPAVWALNEECASCHQQKVQDLSASMHAAQVCGNCHENAAVHAVNPLTLPKVHFDLELCGSCHADQYNTYVKDEQEKTKYGGGTNPPSLWAKTMDFPYLNTIIDGYGFVKEYNEERAHRYLLKDHKDITRFKYETCMQCKSTKIAYYWDSGKTSTVKSTVGVTAGHFDPGETITIPAGTGVVMSTDRVTPYPVTGQPNHEVKVLVTLPDGTKYASYAEPGANTGVDPDPIAAKHNRKVLWAAVYALFYDGQDPASLTVDAGIACNHCHNPHTTTFRLVRKSLLYAIGNTGINPAARRSPKDFELASTQDRMNTLCGQCHVEYVCGNSANDKIDRDFFPWAKVANLESIATTLFDYNQDWLHGTGVRPWQSVDPSLPGYYPTGALYPVSEKLYKNQHPETETFWNSRHYGKGTSCPTCHMPKLVNAAGQTYTAHWLTSPVKLLERGMYTCGQCHRDTPAERIALLQSRQDDIYALQGQVELALVDSLKAINEAKAARRETTTAERYHQMAHVRWENLVVSENSMGFHNLDEVERELNNALGYALSAKAAAQPVPAACSTYTDQQSCTAAGCSWNSRKGICR